MKRNIIKPCAFNTSSDTLYLDHISPLASLLKIPLLVNDEKNAELTRKYWPEIEVRYWPDLAFRLKEITEEFDAFFECNFWSPEFKHFLGLHTKKNVQLIFCPHGQSDKGYLAPSLAPYALQEAVLLHGSLMKEMLMELQIWPSIASYAEVGNFRYCYYQNHQERLGLLAQEEIFSRLNPSNRTLLYGPTWQDKDASGTLFEYGDRLLKELPSDWNLIVKVHPLLAERNPGLYYRLLLLEEKRMNFLLVDQFPSIYPILDKIDVYLGDYSSIGYDMLVFQKPMFFFRRPHLSSVRLHSCGALLLPDEPFFPAIERGLSRARDFKPLQQKLYQQAFAPIQDVKSVIDTFLARRAYS